MNWKLLLIGFCLICLSFNGTGQTAMDSLQSIIKSSPDDSEKVNNILELSSFYFSSAQEKAIMEAKKAEALARKIGFRKGVAYALKNVGIAYYYQGNFVDALDSWNRSKAVFDSIGDKVGVANILSNIGAIYYAEGDYNKALDHYLHSLKVSEETKDTLRILTALTNIGAVYIDRKNDQKSLEYSLRALELSEKIGDQNAVATTSVNIGEVYLSKGDDDKALFYFQKSLDAMEVTDGTVYSMISISKVYKKREEYDKALSTLQEALQLAEELNARPNTVYALTEIGNVQIQQKNFTKAIPFLKEAAKIAHEINLPVKAEQAFKGLQVAYENLARYDSAYKYQQKLLTIKDTLYKIEVDKLLSNQLFNFQIEKKQNEINLLRKDQELKDLDIQKQKGMRNLVIAGLISVIIFLIVVSIQKQKITKERDRSDKLLLNILPYEIAEELKAQGKSDARDFEQVTVLFTDFVSFTQLSEKLPAKDLVNEINYFFKAFDEIVAKYNIEKIKTIGDAYMAAGGLPVPNPGAPKSVILAALEMQEVVNQKRESDRNNASTMPFEMRIGIHTGPVVAGIVGVKKFQYDIWGDTVNTAARMESSCIKGMVNISEATYILVKDLPELKFEHRGNIDVKGKGEMSMYFVSRA